MTHVLASVDGRLAWTPRDLGTREDLELKAELDVDRARAAGASIRVLDGHGWRGPIVAAGDGDLVA